jgi:hypothetical protein
LADAFAFPLFDEELLTQSAAAQAINGFRGLSKRPPFHDF